MNQGITKKRKLWSKAGEKVLRECRSRPGLAKDEKTCSG